MVAGVSPSGTSPAGMPRVAPRFACTGTAGMGKVRTGESSSEDRGGERTIMCSTPTLGC